MKVLFTHELFPPDIRGGGEVTAGGTAFALRDLGVDVRVLSGGDPKIKECRGIPTHRLWLHRYAMNFAVAAIQEAARNVDLIQTFNYNTCLPALIAGRRAGIPVFFYALGLFGETWREMKPFPFGRFWEWLEAYQIRQRWDELFFPSDFALKEGVRLGADPEHSHVAPPGLEQHLLHSAVEKEDVVLFTGKFDTRKGVYQVIEVARALPHVRFRLYGFGPDAAKIRDGVPPNVEVESYVTSERLPDELGRARICIFPSKAETFGMALAQAMACGCAIVSSIPLPFEGYHIDALDTAGMVDAVSRLWSDRELCARMGAANVPIARRYTWDSTARVMLGVYERVLAGRPV